MSKVYRTALMLPTEGTWLGLDRTSGEPPVAYCDGSAWYDGYAWYS